MDEDREQQRKKSSVDHLNDLFNAGQNIYSGGKNLGRAAQFASKAGRLAPILANPVVLTVLGIFIIVFLIVVVFGNQAGGTEITPNTTLAQNPGGLFNITVRQDNISDEQLYNVLKDVFAYSQYTKLLTERGPFSVELYPQSQQGLCSAVVFGNTIKFSGLSFCSQNHQKYLALHESGHIIGNRNVLLFKNFPWLELRVLDANCYNSLGHLVSYFLKNTGGASDRIKDEAFAEAIALFIIHKERSILSDFPNQCPNTYNWIGRNIYSQ